MRSPHDGTVFLGLRPSQHVTFLKKTSLDMIQGSVYTKFSSLYLILYVQAEQTVTHKHGWIDLCPVTEMDGGRNQRTLLARLVNVYSGAIYHTLSSRNVETPTDSFCAIWNANSGHAPLRSNNDLHHKIIDHRAESVAQLVKEVIVPATYQVDLAKPRP